MEVPGGLVAPLDFKSNVGYGNMARAGSIPVHFRFFECLKLVQIQLYLIDMKW